MREPRSVLTIGTFDVPHLGHAYLFRECERFGALTVGLNTDAFVESYKGHAPVFPWHARRDLIARMGYPVVPNHTAGRDLIDRMRPHVLVIGSDWARRDYYAQIDVDQDWLDEHRITMVYVPRVEGLSTTELKARLG
jgi:cytidyltransferase-like protein